MLQPIFESSVKVTDVGEENVTPPLKVPRGVLPDTAANAEAEKVAAPDTPPVLYEVSLNTASCVTVPLLDELPLKTASFVTIPL